MLNGNHSFSHFEEEELNNSELNNISSGITTNQHVKNKFTDNFDSKIENIVSDISDQIFNNGKSYSTNF